MLTIRDHIIWVACRETCIDEQIFEPIKSTAVEGGGGERRRINGG